MKFALTLYLRAIMHGYHLAGCLRVFLLARSCNVDTVSALPFYVVK